MIVGLLKPHPGGDGLVCHAESTAKTAAIIRPVHGYEHQAFHFRKQVGCLVEWNAHYFGWLGDSETTDGATAIVQCDRVPKLCPGEGVHFQDIMEKFNQFIGVLANVLNIVGLFEGVEVAPDLLDAASGRPNDAIVPLEVLNKEAF